MAQDIDYESIASEVDSAYGQSEREVTIDPNAALNRSNEAKSYDYEAAVSSIEAVEGGKTIEIKQEPAVKAAGGGEAAGKEVKVATAEIEKLVSYAGREFKEEIEREIKKVRKGKLILPSLSLQDQVSDLEKMSEGLDEGVFTPEQLAIIKAEVAGLGDSIKYSEQAYADEFQQHLAALRNQRLEEVMAKLNAMNNT